MARRALRSLSEGGLKATESSAIRIRKPRTGALGASLKLMHVLCLVIGIALKRCHNSGTRLIGLEWAIVDLIIG